MKNLVFLFDITVYSIQIIALILTILLFLRLRSKGIKYYLIVLAVTLLDSIANTLRDYLVIININEKIIFILINYFSAVLLMLWFLYSAFLIHWITGKKISKIRMALIVSVSIYPILYVAADVIFYGLLGFQPETEFWSFCNISTLLLRGFYFFIFIYTAAVLFIYRRGITGDPLKKYAKGGALFSILFMAAFAIDLTSVIKGFYLTYLVLMVWNILSIKYTWKSIIPSGGEEHMQMPGRLKTPAEETPAPPSVFSADERIKNDIITVRHDESYIFIKFGDIITVKTSGKKSIMKTVSGSYSTDYSLSDLEGKSCGRLLRVHRNSLINPSRIKKVEKYFSGSYVVIMENNEIVEMSRRLSSVFRNNYLKN